MQFAPFQALVFVHQNRLAALTSFDGSPMISNPDYHDERGGRFRIELHKVE
jgi:hypothetical protein